MPPFICPPDSQEPHGASCTGDSCVNGWQNELGELPNLLTFLLPNLFNDAGGDEEQGFGEHRGGGVLWVVSVVLTAGHDWLPAGTGVHFLALSSGHAAAWRMC